MWWSSGKFYENCQHFLQNYPKITDLNALGQILYETEKNAAFGRLFHTSIITCSRRHGLFSRQQIILTVLISPIGFARLRTIVLRLKIRRSEKCLKEK